MSCYIKELQAEIKELKEHMSWIYAKCYGIGQPLNDNTLGFNKKQMNISGCIHEKTMS